MFTIFSPGAQAQPACPREMDRTAHCLSFSPMNQRSIEEAVAKAFDITMAAAWQCIQVYAIDSNESRFWIDGEDKPCIVL